MGYWEDRQEQAYLAAEQKADAYFKELKASFRQAKREIQKPRKMGKLLRKKIKKASFPEEKKRKRKMP